MEEHADTRRIALLGHFGIALAMIAASTVLGVVGVIDASAVTATFGTAAAVVTRAGLPSLPSRKNGDGHAHEHTV